MNNNYITRMSDLIDCIVSGEIVEFRVVPNKNEHWIPVRIVGVNILNKTVTHSTADYQFQFTSGIDWSPNDDSAIYYQYRWKTIEP